MVEHNFLHGGTKFTPWWNDLLLGSKGTTLPWEKQYNHKENVSDYHSAFQNFRKS